MKKVLAALVASFGLLAVVGVSPAAAAQPITVPDLQPYQCDGSTGTWTLHWLINNVDSANIKAQVAVPGFPLAKSSPSIIGFVGNTQGYPTAGHIFIYGVSSGYSNTATVTVSWADGSEARVGPQTLSLGTCSKTQVTTTTTTPPGKPGTTLPGNATPTTTVAGTPRDSTVGATPSTSVLAQTNGAVIPDDPSSGAVTSAPGTDGSTDTSEASVQLAAGTASSSKSSGSSGALWVVLAIFVVAAAGGAVMLVMSRRSAPPSDDARDS